MIGELFFRLRRLLSRYKKVIYRMESSKRISLPTRPVYQYYISICQTSYCKATDAVYSGLFFCRSIQVVVKKSITVV